MTMLNQFKGGDDQVGRAEEVSVDWIHNRIYILTYKLSSTYQEVQYKHFVVLLNFLFGNYVRLLVGRLVGFPVGGTVCLKFEFP